MSAKRYQTTRTTLGEGQPFARPAGRPWLCTARLGGRRLSGKLNCTCPQGLLAAGPDVGRLAGHVRRYRMAVPQRRPSVSRRVVNRLRTHSLLSLFLGLLLRRRFNRAGLLVRVPGLPRIIVTNLGGSIRVENCTFYPGVRFECWRNASIVIGNGTYLNRNVLIVAAQEVRIGRDCMISWDVVIMDTDQHGIGGAPIVSRPVRIGDRVWIGCRAIILKGVTIGDDAVVAAGAIVAKDVPAGAVVASEAARVLRPGRSLSSS